MASLKDSLEIYLSLLGDKNERNDKLKRSAEVNLVFKNAVEGVYKTSSQMILSHVNAVYIVSAKQAIKEKIKTTLEPNETVLIIYCDDSLIRSDIDARQEFLKLKLKEQNERVGAFIIKSSRFEMKNRHPFTNAINDLSQKNSELLSKNKEIMKNITLSEEENNTVNFTCNKIQDGLLRNSIQKAMISNIKRKKALSYKK